MGKKISFEEVKSYIENTDNGIYSLLTTKEKYKNTKTKLTIECPEGHLFHPTFEKFKIGHRCPICNNTQKHTYEYIENYIESEGYKLLSNEYINGKSKLIVECPDNHIYGVTFFDFQAGKRCKECYYIRSSNNKRLPVEKVIEEVHNAGYKILDGIETYKNLNCTIIVQCPENHIYPISARAFMDGCRCHICGENYLRGDKHPNWDGGKTLLSDYLRNCLKKWKKESMKNCNYKCIITGKQFDIIHHLYGYNMLVDETFEKLDIPIYEKITDYTEEQLKLIELELIKKHNEHELGVCLCNEIHNLFHKEYGSGNNIPEQFINFETRLKSGEFSDFLKDNNLTLII
jgi:hypothetical protein